MKANEAQMFEFVKFEMLGSLEIAQRVILAGGEEDTFAPMVHVYSQNEENGVVCGLLQLPMSAADEEPDEEDPHGMESMHSLKELWSMMIEQVCRQVNAFGYLMLSEAWATMADGSTDAATTMAAMQHASLGDLDLPKREVLMCTYQGPGGPASCLIEIKPGRRKFGDVEWLKEPGVDSEIVVQTRFPEYQDGR